MKVEKVVHSYLLSRSSLLKIMNRVRSHDSSPLLPLELKCHQHWLKLCKKLILPLKIYLMNVRNFAKFIFTIYCFNPYSPNVTFLYPLKTSGGTEM